MENVREYRKRLKSYPGTDIAITSPFFVVKCRSCHAEYYATTPIARCSFCQSEKIEQYPASKDKASQKNA